MDKYLQQIETKYLPLLQTAGDAFTVAQLELTRIQENKASETEKVLAYVKAKDNLTIAQATIATTDPAIKAQVDNII